MSAIRSVGGNQSMRFMLVFRNKGINKEISIVGVGLEVTSKPRACRVIEHCTTQGGHAEALLKLFHIQI